MTPLTELSNDELNRRCAEVMNNVFGRYELRRQPNMIGMWFDGKHQGLNYFTPTTDLAQCMELLIELWDACCVYIETKGGMNYVQVDWDETGNEPAFVIEHENKLAAIVIAFIKWKESEE